MLVEKISGQGNAPDCNLVPIKKNLRPEQRTGSELNGTRRKYEVISRADRDRRHSHSRL